MRLGKQKMRYLTLNSLIDKILFNNPVRVIYIIDEGSTML